MLDPSGWTKNELEIAYELAGRLLGPAAESPVLRYLSFLACNRAGNGPGSDLGFLGRGGGPGNESKRLQRPGKAVQSVLLRVEPRVTAPPTLRCGPIRAGGTGGREYYTRDMETAKPTSLGDRLSKLLEQCELLPGRLDRRRAALNEMQSLGLQIDAAYASFAKSPKTSVDQQLLRQTQSGIQAQIEHLRCEADGIMTQWWDVHRAVGTELAEAARQAPALLPALESFSRLPTPGNSNQKLQVLKLRELLRSAMQPLAPAESASAPRKSKKAHVVGGFRTAKEIAAALGISDKTIYRLAKEGHIPYVRIHCSLRFRQAEIEAWLVSKSFQPAGMKKAPPGKRTISDATWKR